MPFSSMHAYNELAARLGARCQARDTAVEGLLDAGKPEPLLARAQEMRRRLAAGLRMPLPACRPICRVTRRREFSSYAIENVIIEAPQGYFLPLSLYLPTGPHTPPYPAVVVSTGHWPDGKQIPEDQILCANLARLGIAAAAYDPLCQGERTPYAPEEAARYSEGVATDIQAVNAHMQAGNLCYLLGHNLGALFVWDGTRVIDYLCSRPEIDRTRVGATGQSGGGTQTTYLAALDDRISCYSPIQCLSKQALTVKESGIGDCEQSIIGISAEEGFDYADVLWAAAPKPCMVNAGSEDFFRLEGVQHLAREMQRLYAALGAEGRFTLRVAPCAHEISPQTRLYAYDFFCRQLLGRPGPAEEAPAQPLPDGELACLPAKGYGLTAVEMWRPALCAAQRARPRGPALRRALRERFPPPGEACTVEPLWKDGPWQSFLVYTEDGRPAACQYLDRGGRVLTVAAAAPDCPLSALEALPGDVLRILPWGMAGTFLKRRAGYDEEAALFNAAAVLGESVLACRLRQVEAAVARHRKTGQPVCLVGQGPAAPLALLASVLLPGIAGTVVLDALLSYDALFDTRHHFLQETAMEPGLLALCDLPDLAGLCKPVTAIDPLDAEGSPLPPGAATPIPCLWAADGWAAAAAWLEVKTC